MLTLYISRTGMASERLDLPVPLDEIKQRMETIRVKEQLDRVPLIYDTDCPVPIIRYHLRNVKLDSDAALQKLNQLAEIINGMNAAGHYHLCKALDTESRQSLDDVLRAASHIKTSGMDCYEIIPGITSHQALGKWLVEHDYLEEKAPETLRPYLDYRSIGVDYYNTHEGEFLLQLQRRRDDRVVRHREWRLGQRQLLQRWLCHSPGFDSSLFSLTDTQLALCDVYEMLTGGEA